MSRDPRAWRRWGAGLALGAALAASAAEQEVRVHPRPQAALAERWDWAAQQAGPGSVWVGWGLRRLVGRNEAVGSFFGRGSERRPLQDLIYGTAPEAELRSGIEGKLWRQVAVLLRFEGGALDAKHLEQIELSSLHWPMDLGGAPLVWMGEATDRESLAQLQRFQGGLGTERLREGLVEAVAYHEGEAEAVLAFLKNSLEKDPADRVRAEAAGALGGLEGDDALESLLAAARGDRSRRVREEAVEAIGDMGSAAATKALEELARKGKDLKVREEAIERLAQRTPPEQAAAIFEAIALDDTYEELQAEAVDALGELPRSAGEPGLKKVAERHPSEDIREKAIDRLIERATPEAALQVLERAALQDPSEDLQRAAAAELAEFPPALAMPIAKKLAASHPSDEVRWKALEVVAKRGTSTEAVAELERAALQDPSRDVQEHATEGLSELPASSGIPALLRLGREHPDPDIRSSALHALLKRAPAALVAPVFEAAAQQDASEDVRETALEALAELPVDVGLPGLARIAKTHPDPEMRREAVEHLGKSGDPRARKLHDESEKDGED